MSAKSHNCRKIAISLIDPARLTGALNSLAETHRQNEGPVVRKPDLRVYETAVKPRVGKKTFRDYECMLRRYNSPEPGRKFASAELAGNGQSRPGTDTLTL
jgi:hypothetical protein